MTAFNIQSFGRYKMSQVDVRKALSKILTRSDISLVQEIRDKSQASIGVLLNDMRIASNRNYKLLLSPRLGDGSHKEQLAYIYDGDLFEVLSSLIPDDENENFYREPFIVDFKEKKSQVTFTSIGAHLSPKTVIREINAIGEIALDYLTKSPSKKIVVLGDLNASCDYIRKDDLADNLLRGEDFYWKVKDSEDTTVHDTDCAYDRIILTNSFKQYINLDKNPVYDFSRYLNLTFDQSIKISDHFPVEFEFSFN